LERDCSGVRDGADRGHYRDYPRGARADHVAALDLLGSFKRPELIPGSSSRRPRSSPLNKP
jgi:hypothetical protein